LAKKRSNPKSESESGSLSRNRSAGDQPRQKKRSAPPAKSESSSAPKRRRRRRKPASKEQQGEQPAAEPAVADDSPADAVAEPLHEPGAPIVPGEPAAFAKLGLSEVMLAALQKAGYYEPTPIQGGLIPRAMAEVDVMGQARTGTGKTAAFAIPILEQLKPHRKGAYPQALVLVPTRELAVQVRDECAKLAAGRRAQVVAVYGGKPIRSQTDKLSRGAEIVVGTPGRVLDLIDRHALVLNEIRFVVLDEADRMLDIGFRPDIEKILRRCPQARQTLLLSATIPPPVKRLAQRYMRDPEELDFSPTDVSVDTIEQFYFTIDPTRKFDLLVSLLEREQPRQAIIFCRTKRGTDKVHRRLSRKVESADVIHGDLAQSARDRVMRSFRAGKTRFLVATDVVGRGIDVTSISHIINYDIPQFCDDYVHRVGRAGRMGREGVAYTFVSPEEGNELTRIEMRINRLLQRDEIAGSAGRERAQATETINQEPGQPPEPDPDPERKPVFGSRGRRRHRRAL